MQLKMGSFHDYRSRILSTKETITRAKQRERLRKLALADDVGTLNRLIEHLAAKLELSELFAEEAALADDAADENAAKKGGGANGKSGKKEVGKDGEPVKSALRIASEAGHEVFVARLLPHAWVNADWRDAMRRHGAQKLQEHNPTAMHQLSARGQMEQVCALLDEGWDPNVRDDQGSTALMRAALVGHPELVQRLLERSDPNAQDHEGWTAIMFASMNRGPCHEQTVQILARKSNPNIKNKEGQTALIIALENNSAEAVQILAPITSAAESGAFAQPIEWAMARENWSMLDALAVNLSQDAAESLLLSISRRELPRLAARVESALLGQSAQIDRLLEENAKLQERLAQHEIRPEAQKPAISPGGTQRSSADNATGGAAGGAGQASGSGERSPALAPPALRRRGRAL